MIWMRRTNLGLKVLDLVVSMERRISLWSNTQISFCPIQCSDDSLIGAPIMHREQQPNQQTIFWPMDFVNKEATSGMKLENVVFTIAFQAWKDCGFVVEKIRICELVRLVSLLVCDLANSFCKGICCVTPGDEFCSSNVAAGNENRTRCVLDAGSTAGERALQWLLFRESVWLSCWATCFQRHVQEKVSKVVSYISFYFLFNSSQFVNTSPMLHLLLLLY